MTFSRIASAAALLFTIACDTSEVAEQCAQNDLVGQCPVGSNPVLGAQAESACGGEFNANIVTEGGSATGQCTSAAGCEVLCQFANPCTCGIATISKDAIVCAQCAAQSCGDDRCEGTERATCASGEAGCFPCAEDCGGATCGDGDCTGDEDPVACPQDCADECVPSSKFCVGTIAKVCAANGQSTSDFDCATQGQSCKDGDCVAQ
ncbi:MAG: hypothetical protein IT385_26890 [Deltaproteobacteria bacterium]|nr:hypothetical protein [Deltaproteobacteria bacterium]